MSAPGARLAGEQTHRVLAAQMTLAEQITLHQLRVTDVTCSAGARQLLPDGGHQFVGAPTITITTDPASFLGWVEHLGVDRVVLRRRPFEVIAATGAIDLVAHLWRVSTLIVRSKSLRAADDLPGDPVIPWRQDRAYVGVERLTAALTARGLA